MECIITAGCPPEEIPSRRPEGQSSGIRAGILDLNAEHTPIQIESKRERSRGTARTTFPAYQNQLWLRDPAPNNPPDFSPLEYCNSDHGMLGKKSH